MLLEQYTALYSDLDIKYNQAMSGSYGDLSFYSDEVEVVAGLKNGRISGFWRPMVAVGDDKLLKLHIERLWDISRDIYYQDFLIDGRLSVISQFLLRHGYKATSHYTQVIDLTKTIEELHADLRKSYKQLVREHGEYLANDLKTLSSIHASTRGATRPEKTWEIQEEMLRKGQAVVVNNKDKTSSALFYIGTDGCYYACGASLPNTNSHSVIWFGILMAREWKCRFLEMGEQYFTFNNGNEKLVSISKFKRGMGGQTKVRLILQKKG